MGLSGAISKGLAGFGQLWGAKTKFTLPLSEWPYLWCGLDGSDFFPRFSQDFSPLMACGT